MKYYSDKTKKFYTSLEEIESAEKQYDDEHSAEIKKAEERKNDAKAIEEATAKYHDNNRERIKKLNDLKKQLVEEDNKELKEINDMKNNFIKKYGSLHMTYSTTTDAEDIIDQFFRIWW